VHYYVFAMLAFETHWLHQPSAGVGAIAGHNVDMAAPKACGTVIGITVALDLGPTDGAGEIFFGTRKSGHVSLALALNVIPLPRSRCSMSGSTLIKSLAALILSLTNHIELARMQYAHPEETRRK
jgi:hypothetical protein